MFKTDLDLAGYFTRAVSEPYGDGVEFLTALPSHALVRFRVAAEALCHRLHEMHGIEQDQPNLCDSINLLRRAGAISYAVRDRLHKVRIVCNHTLHHQAKVGEETVVDRSAENASQVRDELCAALAEVHAQENSLTAPFEVEKAVIDVQEWKSLVFCAMTERNAKLKFKAALWFEGEGDRFSRSSPNYIVSDEFMAQVNQMYRIAACLYLAAWKHEPNHVEAMFRYASMVDTDKIDGDKKDEAETLIKKAADYGLGEACFHYALILFDPKRREEKRQDFAGALRYLEKAVSKGIVRGHYGLGQLFQDEHNPDRDLARAVEHYEDGVLEEEPCSVFELGRTLWEGKLAKRDRERARKLISKAAELGHGQALFYQRMELEGGTRAMADQFKAIGHALKAAMQPPGPRKLTAEQKLGANDPCHCGSGLKYKRCHRDKDHQG